MTCALVRRSGGSAAFKHAGVFAFVGERAFVSGLFGRGGLGGFVLDAVELKNVEMAEAVVIDAGECGAYEGAGSDGRRRGVWPSEANR